MPNVWRLLQEETESNDKGLKLKNLADMYRALAQGYTYPDSVSCVLKPKLRNLI